MDADGFFLTAMELGIRLLEREDLGFADDVRERAGWNQLRPDWERFLALEPEGCFLAEADGQPAGTATTTAYGRDLAWIGMVLVHPDFRRRGMGTALLERSIHYLREERGVRCVKLDATPEGRPLYEKLGFRAQWGLRRWWRGGVSRQLAVLEEVTEMAESSFQLDREVFGADREDLLRALFAGRLAFARRDDGSFGLTRDGARAVYVGPVTAASVEAGLSLARELIEGAPADREIFWDLPDDNGPAVALAESLGFRPVRELTRMRLGEEDTPGDPARMFGIADPGLG